MNRCDNNEKFLFAENVKITGTILGYDLRQYAFIKKLIKEIIVYGGDESTNNSPSVPLLADWATVEFHCSDKCLENCTLEIDISHLFDYLIFIGLVVLVCSIFVAVMVRWSKKLKKKKF